MKKIKIAFIDDKGIVFICDTNKNRNCKKTNCSKKHGKYNCFCTLNEDNAKEFPIDIMDKIYDLVEKVEV